MSGKDEAPAQNRSAGGREQVCGQQIWMVGSGRSGRDDRVGMIGWGRSGIVRRPGGAFNGSNGRRKLAGVEAERGKKVSNRAAGAGIVKVGCDLVERNEDEGALGKARMRDFESGLTEHEIAIENEIEIEGARAVGDGVEAVAPEFLFDGKECAEELKWRERGFKRGGGIEEARLIGKTDGRGGVERGAGGDAAERAETRERGGERDIGRSGGAGQIRAKGNVSDGHV